MATYIRRDEFVKSTQGPAVSGAQVYVCTQPANSALTPPSPLATVYGDSAGVTPLVQPMITDGFGHTYFYVVSGTYTIVIVENGKVQAVYPDQSIGSGVTLETNGVINPTQTIENLIAGNNITLTADGAGGTTITSSVSAVTLKTNGVSNTIQDILNLTNADGSVSLVADSLGDVTISASASARFSSADWFIWQAWPYSANGTATIVATTSGSPSLLPCSQTEPICLNFSFSSGVASEGRGVNESTKVNSTDFQFTIGLLDLWQCRLAILSTDAARHWVGFSNNPSASVNGGNGCATDSFIGSASQQDFVGFRYSTNAGDTHWMAYVGGYNLTSETVTSTGVAPNFTTVSQVLQIAVVGSNFVFFINGSVVATIAIPALYKTSFGASHGTFGSVLTADNEYSSHPAINWDAMWLYYEMGR